MKRTLPPTASFASFAGVGVPPPPPAVPPAVDDPMNRSQTPHLGANLSL